MCGRREEAREPAVRVGDEVGTAAVLDDASVVHDRDLVDGAERRQTVGDEDCGPAGDETVDGGLDQQLGFGIEAAGRLVEDDETRVGEEDPSEREELRLAGRQAAAVGAELGVEALAAGPTATVRARARSSSSSDPVVVRRVARRTT